MFEGSWEWDFRVLATCGLFICLNMIVYTKDVRAQILVVGEVLVLV